MSTKIWVDLPGLSYQQIYMVKIDKFTKSDIKTWGKEALGYDLVINWEYGTCSAFYNRNHNNWFMRVYLKTHEDAAHLILKWR